MQPVLAVVTAALTIQGTTALIARTGQESTGRQAQPSGTRNTQTAMQAREYLVALSDAGLWAGVVLLARGDSIVLHEAFGAADVRNGQRNRVDTRFRIGSITKSMTWAAIDWLVRRGQLQLDASVRDLIDEPGLPAALTVQHLLNHRGGIPDWNGLPDADRFAGRETSTRELAAWLASTPLRFTPGAGREYSNSGYILLARVVEVVTQRDFGAVLSTGLFDGLGMTDTRHAIEPAPTNAARGHEQGRPPRAMTPALTTPHPSMYVGSGSVVSTARDLLRWSQSPQSRQFPWDRAERHGRPVVFLGGFVTGFGAWIERYPDEDITIIALTNLGNGSMQRVIPDLGAILLQQPLEALPRYRDLPLATNQAAPFVGVWSCTGGPSFTIQANDRHVDLHWRHGPVAHPLWAQSDSVLFYPQDWATIRRDGSSASRLQFESTYGRWGCERERAGPTK